MTSLSHHSRSGWATKASPGNPCRAEPAIQHENGASGTEEAIGMPVALHKRQHFYGHHGKKAMKFDGHGHLDALAAVDPCQLVTAVAALVERGRHSTTAGEDDVAEQVTQRAMSAAIRAEQKIVTLRERIRCLERLVTTDELTGVLNRRGFEAELRRTLDLAQRHGETGVLLFVDLDGFKRINDTYGHAAGDEVLRHVALLLKKSVRRSDVVARLGGDEFVVLLTKACAVGAKRRWIALKQILRSAVLHWHDHVIEVRASVGARPYGPSDECDALIKEADECMYAQKPGRSARVQRLEPKNIGRTRNIPSELFAGSMTL
jgi:diguanylate cyclase (GGDEF)-like protein